VITAILSTSITDDDADLLTDDVEKFKVMMEHIPFVDKYKNADER
jgi:hypothetical protein